MEPSTNVAQSNPVAEPIMQLFGYAHLPEGVSQ